jgi:hypothetical protein
MNPEQAVFLMQERTRELWELTELLVEEEKKMGKNLSFPYHTYHAKAVSDCIVVPFGKLYPVEIGLLEKKYTPSAN